MNRAISEGKPRRSLRSRLRDGTVTTSMFSIVPSPVIVEMVGLAGFDSVIIDMEHGPIGIDRLTSLVVAAELRGMHAIVRVPECRTPLIGAALDVGAAGVLVPQIENPEDARFAVAASRFAPEGNRGVNPWVRAADYGRRSDWLASANSETAVMVMVEGKGGLQNLDGILAVPGLDAIFLGPVDMANSLGVPGQPEHPLVVDALVQAAAQATERKVAVGVFTRVPSTVRQWIDRGVSLIAVSEDTVTIQDAFSALYSQIGAPSDRHTLDDKETGD